MVLAGDLADVVSPVPHEVQTVVIARYLRGWPTHHRARRLRQPRPGRARGHGEQVAGWLRALDDGLHVDGASVDVGDTRFTVCPWWDGP